MEFLKDLFPEGKALTYEELSKAAKDKGFEVVNAAGGAYVPKASVDTLIGQLNEANTKLNGYDPDWEKKMTEDRQKLERDRMDFAIEQGVPTLTCGAGELKGRLRALDKRPYYAVALYSCHFEGACDREVRPFPVDGSYGERIHP